MKRVMRERKVLMEKRELKERLQDAVVNFYLVIYLYKVFKVIPNSIEDWTNYKLNLVQDSFDLLQETNLLKRILPTSTTETAVETQKEVESETISETSTEIIQAASEPEFSSSFFVESTTSLSSSPSLISSSSSESPTSYSFESTFISSSFSPDLTTEELTSTSSPINAVSATTILPDTSDFTLEPSILNNKEREEDQLNFGPVHKISTSTKTPLSTSSEYYLDSISSSFDTSEQTTFSLPFQTESLSIGTTPEQVFVETLTVKETTLDFTSTEIVSDLGESSTVLVTNSMTLINTVSEEENVNLFTTSLKEENTEILTEQAESSSFTNFLSTSTLKSERKETINQVSPTADNKNIININTSASEQMLIETTSLALKTSSEELTTAFESSTSSTDKNFIITSTTQEIMEFETTTLTPEISSEEPSTTSKTTTSLSTSTFYINPIGSQIRCFDYYYSGNQYYSFSPHRETLNKSFLPEEYFHRRIQYSVAVMNRKLYFTGGTNWGSRTTIGGKA